MNVFQNSEVLQKFVRLAVHILAVGVAGLLILAWILTGSLFQLGERIAQRKIENKKLKGRL
jgi:uncharacterized protein involved in response to NO